MMSSTCRQLQITKANVKLSSKECTNATNTLVAMHV